MEILNHVLKFGVLDHILKIGNSISDIEIQDMEWRFRISYDHSGFLFLLKWDWETENNLPDLPDYDRSS